MNIYITHYTPLINRKANIIKQFENYNITDYTFIETYDKEQFMPTDFSKFTNITLGETSLFLKHIEIFIKEQDNNNDLIVVFEDDAILVDNFKEKLDIYIKELEKLQNWDIIFTADCCNLHVAKNKDEIFYRTNKNRGTCMYILNKGVSRKILQIINNEKNINKPIDLWFDVIQQKYNLSYYWAEPTIVQQGSEIGVFKSALR
jgi:glycosyl transferase family 25